MNTSLVISPHRELHSIPWAALLPGWDSHHLVELCNLQMVPSLQFLRSLWQRSEIPAERARGVLLGLSEFQDVRPALPAAIAEIQEIAASSHPESMLLLDADARWDCLLGLRDRLAGFGFMHLSSHISHDPRTGRLSSLALHDQDVPLDWLRDLAPLPGLVTLSACHGAQSLVYEGDEHVGMAIACLLVGASTVIGSLWPVLDSAAAELMPRFYEYFFAGHSPAQSLARSQRVAIQKGQPLESWAGMVCLGL
jgi:CHAT domain-containing protein